MYLILSIVFHTVFIILCMLSFTDASKKDVIQDYAIILETVPISELTNIKVKQDKSPSENAPPKKVEPSPTPPAPEKPKTPAKQEPEETKTEKIEDVPIKDIKKQEKPVKQDKKDDSLTQDLLKEMQQKANEKEVKRKKDEQKQQEKDKNKKAAKKLNTIMDGLKGETNKTYNSTMPLSMSQLDAIRSQIQKVWNIASFSASKDLAMQVTLKVKLDSQGNVTSVSKMSGLSGSKHYQAFVESAIRAVKMASPLQNLPAEKYDTWQELHLTFDSSGLIGQ